MTTRRANPTRQAAARERKWEEVREMTGEREKGGVREEGREAALLEAGRERADGEIRGGRKAGILKAAVTPVTSHLSNPAPT